MRAFGNNNGFNGGFSNTGASSPLASRISNVGGGFANSGFGNSNSRSGDIPVEIRNWEGGGKDDCVGFIFRKTKIQLRDSYISGPVLHANVRASDARPLAKWSGVRFAGKALKITVPDDSTSAQTNNSTGAVGAIEMLKTFLQTRYNPQASILDLQNLKNDQYLISNNLFSSVSTSSKMFPALMKVAGDNIKNVDTVNLSGNTLPDVVAVTSLAQAYPDLKNLSLANNSISRVRGLENWRQKFRNLRELVLTGNPVTNELNYKEEIMKLFPRLVMLDGQVVRNESELDVLRLPLPVKHIFFEDPTIEDLAGNFVTNYFDLFDRDRAQLLNLYDMTSQFSLSLNSASPRQPGGSQGPPSWSSYIPVSRNLQKITTANARHHRLCIGPSSIEAIFRKIPRTEHHLVPEKFALEAWRTVGVKEENDTGIVISVHGEFAEPNNILRSFDRTFIVVQGPGGNMLVASDMLTVRAYSGFDAWKESTEALAPVPTAPVVPGTPLPGTPVGAGTPTPANIPAELHGLNNDQLVIIEQLMHQTRLNAQYARMCVEQANFDINQALALFQQSQGSLPPDAYVA